MDLPDHRRLGRQLKIFATEEQCGSGLPFWLPAGAAIKRELESFIVDLERRHRYVHVSTPAMAKRELYDRSGHLAHYQDDMYPPMELGSEQLVLRPMLCPHHILIYAEQSRSLRDLPLRLAEVGVMFRYERSGVVGGLSRVRQMSLNDGHVFCTPEQVRTEIADILVMVEEAYRTLQIPPPRLRLSRPGTGPKYATDAVMWQQSEAMIRAALDEAGVSYVEVEGEAAFYAPKLDLQVSDPQGREQTLSTIQVDLYLPRRFDLHYQGKDERSTPVMIHRSIISTLERMVAHLLEIHDGALPFWLSPTHILVLPASSHAREYAAQIGQSLTAAGLRVQGDERDMTLAARVRAAQQQKIPCLAIVGDREAQAGTIAVRLRDGQQLAPMPVETFARAAEHAYRTRGPLILERPL